MSNWKAKKKNNQYDQKKKEFVPNRILRTIRLEIFLTKISQEIRIIHQATRIILRVKNLLITMVITPRTLNAKNLLRIGSVMAHTMPQFVLIEKILSVIFIPYRRK